MINKKTKNEQVLNARIIKRTQKGKMTEHNTELAPSKCYNSFSCVLSVLIILFIIGSIAWDVMISKPEMRKSIDEIRIEVKRINEKIDSQFAKDSLTNLYYRKNAKIFVDKEVGKSETISEKN